MPFEMLKSSPALLSTYFFDEFYSNGSNTRRMVAGMSSGPPPVIVPGFVHPDCAAISTTDFVNDGDISVLVKTSVGGYDDLITNLEFAKFL